MSTVQGGQGNIVTNGLVLNLDAANPRSYPQPYNGTTWQNIAPVSSSLTGSLVGGVTYTGSNGGALVFDGVNGYVDLGDVLGFNTPNFSFGSWIYFDGVSQNGAILTKRNDSPFNQYNLGISNSPTVGGLGTKLTATIIPDGGGSVGIFSTFEYNLAPFGAGWYNALVTVDVTSQRLYINGQNVLTNTRDYTGRTFLISGKPLYVGSINITNTPSNFFRGRIGNSLIYNRTLNASEVLQNFNATRARFGI
jgi:hypothetical protein